MIFKSYIIEENFALISKNLNLFYGENIGLINSFKSKIKLHNSDKSEIINFSQDEIISNKNTFHNEVTNQSLFSKNKIFIIEQATDKILDYLDNILISDENNKFFIFANILDKKSKLRTYFETEKNCDIVASYKDNEISNNEHVEHSSISRYNINETKRKKLLNVLEDLVQLRKKLDTDK